MQMLQSILPLFTLSSPLFEKRDISWMSLMQSKQRKKRFLLQIGGYTLRCIITRVFEEGKFTSFCFAHCHCDAINIPEA
jgi:hypothetical protein